MLQLIHRLGKRMRMWAYNFRRRQFIEKEIDDIQIQIDLARQDGLDKVARNLEILKQQWKKRLDAMQ